MFVRLRAQFKYNGIIGDIGEDFQHAHMSIKGWHRGTRLQVLLYHLRNCT